MRVFKVSLPVMMLMLFQSGESMEFFEQGSAESARLNSVLAQTESIEEQYKDVYRSKIKLEGELEQIGENLAEFRDVVRGTNIADEKRALLCKQGELQLACGEKEGRLNELARQLEVGRLTTLEKEVENEFDVGSHDEEPL